MKYRVWKGRKLFHAATKMKCVNEKQMPPNKQFFKGWCHKIATLLRLLPGIKSIAIALGSQLFDTLYDLALSPPQFALPSARSCFFLMFFLSFFLSSNIVSASLPLFSCGRKKIPQRFCFYRFMPKNSGGDGKNICGEAKRISWNRKSAFAKKKLQAKTFLFDGTEVKISP